MEGGGEGGREGREGRKVWGEGKEGEGLLLASHAIAEVGVLEHTRHPFPSNIPA